MRPTAAPFALTAVILAVCGGVMHAAAPQASTLSEFVAAMNAPEAAR